MPCIVGAYNKFMGGVDLLDSFAAKYKCPLKSHRWYIYIFWHTIILAVVNAWLLYKPDCKALNVSKKETLNRRQFQALLESSLILVGTTPIKRKRGRPTSSHGSPVLKVHPQITGDLEVKSKSKSNSICTLTNRYKQGHV